MPIDFDGTLGISATGNIAGSYLLGNGSQITGLPAGYSNTDVSNYLNGNITTSIIPSGATQTLGNAANPWQSLYVSNATIYIDSVPVTVTTGNVLQVNGANVVTSAPGGLITADGLSVTGNTTVNNLDVTGTTTIAGNITQINGNSAQFFGDASGFGALYAGITVGYANLPATVLQVSSDSSDYAQVNFQNINSGVSASADYVATADTGTNSTFYVDMGIASSTFTGASGNSLGNVIKPNDAYIYTFGQTGNAAGGNLIVAAGTTGKQVKIVAGGGSTADVAVTVSAPGTTSSSTTTGTLIVAGGAGISGNVNAGNIAATNLVGTLTTAAQPNITSVGTLTSLSVTGTIQAGNINANVSGTITNAINVTGNSQPNITSVGTLTSLDVSGNIGGANLNVTADAVITGNLTVNGTTTTVNSNTVTINDKFINVANNASSSTQANGGGLGVGPVGSEYATLTFNNSTTAWNTNIPLSVNGNVSATFFNGNGAALTGVVATSIGTLVSLSVTGSVTGGQFIGNGNTLSNIQGANVSGAVATATTADTVTGNAQANITSVGTLTSLTVSGNTAVTGGMFKLPRYTTIQISALSGMVGGELVFNTDLGVIQGYQTAPSTVTGWVSWTTAVYQ